MDSKPKIIKITVPIRAEVLKALKDYLSATGKLQYRVIEDALTKYLFPGNGKRKKHGVHF